MDKQEVMPVTRYHQTQVNIGYAAKISKQVLRTQINDRIKQLSDQVDSLQEQAMAIFTTAELSEHLQQKVYLHLKNDSDVTRLRRLVNKFSPHDEAHHFKTNEDFVDSMEARYEASRHSMCRSDADSIATLLSTELFNVIVTLKVTPNVDGEYEHQCGFSMPIALDNDWREKIIKQAAIVDQKYKLECEVHDLKKKLENINELVEEMEAKMLVDELSRSEEGQRILQITSSIIGNTLGETPSMLAVESVK